MIFLAFYINEYWLSNQPTVVLLHPHHRRCQQLEAEVLQTIQEYIAKKVKKKTRENKAVLW